MMNQNLINRILIVVILVGLGKDIYLLLRHEDKPVASNKIGMVTETEKKQSLAEGFR